ncbi:MAG: hypothetical protein MZV70_57700 [Desulfobacterales bacterium]|nr:hypothetical protein [Desulfobacterales bacterium]
MMIGNAFEPADFCRRNRDSSRKKSRSIISTCMQSGQTGRADAPQGDGGNHTTRSRACLLEPILESLIESGELEQIRRKRSKIRKADPYTVAEEIARRFLKKQEEINEDRKSKKTYRTRKQSDKEESCQP